MYIHQPICNDACALFALQVWVGRRVIWFIVEKCLDRMWFLRNHPRRFWSLSGKLCRISP